MSTVPATTLIPRYLGEPMRPAPVTTRLVTAEFLVPGLRPELPRHLSPRRPSRRMRFREEGAVFGIIAASIAPACIAVAVLFGAGA